MHAKFYWSGHLLINIHESIKIALLGTPTTAVQDRDELLVVLDLGDTVFLAVWQKQDRLWPLLAPRSLESVPRPPCCSKSGTAKTVPAVPCAPALFNQH